MNIESFRVRAREIAQFCRREGYNERVVLLWNLSLHSGRRRFVVWNLEQQRAERAFVVSHGSGSRGHHRPSCYARLSNEDGSHLSSEGRALISERYYGRYGVAYRLDGLDATNSALRERCVVLHGWQYTTPFPIYPLPTIGSWGCPVLSRRDMRWLDERLRGEERVVLWCYR